MNPNSGERAFADLFTESRVKRGNLVSVWRWTAGLLFLALVGVGTGLVLLILVPIAWSRAVFGFDRPLEEGEMSWLE